MLIKRIVDIGIIVVILPVWLPVFIGVSILIYVFMGRPIFFSQKRHGRHGVAFNMFKFRTMIEAAPGRERDEFRITNLGRFLRRSSLDEIPEILHVLRGEMSLVGPRPLLPAYTPLYTKNQRRRLKVFPESLDGRRFMGEIVCVGLRNSS